MVYGKTLELRQLDAQVFYAHLNPDNQYWMPKDRDRTLRGKARIKARKAARRG